MLRWGQGRQGRAERGECHYNSRNVVRPCRRETPGSRDLLREGGDARRGWRQHQNKEPRMNTPVKCFRRVGALDNVDRDYSSDENQKGEERKRTLAASIFWVLNQTSRNGGSWGAVILAGKKWLKRASHHGLLLGEVEGGEEKEGR